jgi:hypothetical protein
VEQGFSPALDDQKGLALATAVTSAAEAGQTNALSAGLKACSTL